MVVKSPFLSEKDHETRFLVRNEGAYRGLGSLFPAASLLTLTRLAEINSRRRLMLARRVAQVTKKGNRVVRTFVTQATAVLKEELGPDTSHGTYQRYLDLSSDMRIQRAMATEYYVHSYGTPLTLLHRWRNWSELDPRQDIAWRVYFTDRLLFEDGDYIRAVLKMATNGFGASTSKELGETMHELVFRELEERMRRVPMPYATRNYIIEKTREYERARNKVKMLRENGKEKEADLALRRTELEFTVRRDWMTELGFLGGPNGSFVPTDEGRRLAECVERERLDVDFFTKRIFTAMADVFGLAIDPNRELLGIIEKAYNDLTRPGSGIAETMGVLNSALLDALPIMVAERDSALQKLVAAIEVSSTSLVLMSGYRTRDYFLKRRPTA